MNRVLDADLIAPRTLCAMLGYLRNVHTDTWGVDPPFFKSYIYHALNAKGLKHLVRHAVSREWIVSASQWEYLFPLTQWQLSEYIKSVCVIPMA
jgi:hypothetical protein